MSKRMSPARIGAYGRWLLSRSEFRERPLRMLWRALQWQVVSALNREPVVRLDTTIEIRSPRDNLSASATFYLGFSEPAFYQFLSGFLRPGMTVVDVGANVGF